MGFLQKHKSLLILLLTVLLVGVGFYLSKTLSKQANALTKDITAKQEKLKGYYSNIENAPSPSLVSRLTRDKITLEGNYESVSSRYALLPVLTLPEGEIFPSLYYKETMYLVLDDLRRQSESKSIALSSLGIAETGLPAAEQVPALLVLLDTVKRLSEEVFRSRISSLDSVQLGTPSVNPFYIEIPMAVTVSGSSSRLAYFFENLGSSQTIFVLENMAMVRGGGGGIVQGATMPGAPGIPLIPGAAPGTVMRAAPVVSVATGDTFQASLSLKRILWGKDLVEKIKIVAVSAPTGGVTMPGFPGGTVPGAAPGGIPTGGLPGSTPQPTRGTTSGPRVPVPGSGPRAPVPGAAPGGTVPGAAGSLTPVAPVGPPPALPGSLQR